jgi:hypothetical protein
MFGSAISPVVYFSFAIILLGIAFAVAPKKSLIGRVHAVLLSKKGAVAVYYPLLSSLIISFVLTALLKLFQG